VAPPSTMVCSGLGRRSASRTIGSGLACACACAMVVARRGTALCGARRPAVDLPARTATRDRRNGTRCTRRGDDARNDGRLRPRPVRVPGNLDRRWERGGAGTRRLRLHGTSRAATASNLRRRPGCAGVHGRRHQGSCAAARSCAQRAPSSCGSYGSYVDDCRWSCGNGCGPGSAVPDDGMGRGARLGTRTQHPSADLGLSRALEAENPPPRGSRDMGGRPFPGERGASLARTQGVP
jgi:hypothetical protein